MRCHIYGVRGEGRPGRQPAPRLLGVVMAHGHRFGPLHAVNLVRMTKLRAHYDAKLKAFVPDEPVDLPDGAVVTVDEGAVPGPPAIERRHGYFIVGGPGVSGKELAERAERLLAEYGPAFPGDEDSVEVGRRLREDGR